MKSTSKIFILLIFVLSGYKIAFCDIYVYEDNTGKRHFSPAPLNSEYKLYLNLDANKNRPTYAQIN